MTRCIFCDIVAGLAPASVVHRDERCVAFMDLYPITPGHLLVVPRRHAASLAELDPADGGHLFVTAQRMAAALRRSGLRCEGVNLFLADGEAAGQEIFHVHLHVVPRFAGDGVKVRAATGRPTRGELDAHAAAIAAVL
ncbi:MAG: HIT family protein [Anaerolineae bacterium]|nr:HIT family protein [Anaerolineae bacterium]